MAVYTEVSDDDLARFIPYDDAYGLQPSGFTLTWPNCNNGGNLLGVQGMVFVR